MDDLKGHFFSKKQLTDGTAYSQGAQPDQIELALEVMESHGHDEAHFGIFGGFIYSQSSSEEENYPVQ